MALVGTEIVNVVGLLGGSPSATTEVAAVQDIANLNPLAAVCTTQTDRASSTVLTNITGLSVNVVPGKYVFRSHITGVATANGGVKLAIGGTATASSFTCVGTNRNGTFANAITTTTTMGNAVAASTSAFDNAWIEGAIVVSVAGTLTVQIAQNASHVDTTSAYVNSDFIVTRVQ